MKKSIAVTLLAHFAFGCTENGAEPSEDSESSSPEPSSTLDSDPPRTGIGASSGIGTEMDEDPVGGTDPAPDPSDGDPNGTGGGAVDDPGFTGFQTVAFLKSIAGISIASGQHNDQKDGTDENHYTERVHELTGKYPALYGADFLFHDSEELRWKITYEAERQWEAGAMINLMWHACPPTQGASCNWDGGLLSYMNDADWSDLVTDGGTLNAVWKSRMDQIAIYLQYLEGRGVEVMFRPLHEQNQSAFWWGGRTDENGTKRLFQLTHDYFTHDKGLSNLIWVWDVQDLDASYGGYNPGSEYFDIAALDVYSDAYFNNSYYEALLAQAGDAPVAIGECFGLPPESALAAQSQWTFFMNWAYGLEVDWNGTPTNSVEYIREVYESPRVLTLDEMPGWQ